MNPRKVTTHNEWICCIRSDENFPTTTRSNRPSGSSIAGRCSGLYLTGRCNLDCSYCTEYDNSKPHPQLEDLNLWIRKIRELGTMRIALVGANRRCIARFRDCRLCGEEQRLAAFMCKVLQRLKRTVDWIHEMKDGCIIDSQPRTTRS
jgi:hypothetical protein